MNLLVVIVNYRTAPTTLEALTAVLPQVQELGGRVEVVDNDSGDGSYELLTRAVSEREWQALVRVTASTKNGGFGFGNNVAIRAALRAEPAPDYVYLLNPDAFVEAGAVAALAAYLSAHTEVGIVGSRIRSPAGDPHVSAFRFPSLLGEVEGSLRLGSITRLLDRWVVAPAMPEQSCAVDWVSGASIMIRRQVFERVGLFDEQFFLYYEETDLCRRARAAGFEIHHVCESAVRHIGSVSTGMGERGRRIPRYWLDSRTRYFEKHHGPWYLLGSNAVFALGFSAWRLRRALQRKPDTDPPHLLRDFVEHALDQLREKRAR